MQARRKIVELVPEWHVARDGIGHLAIVDQRGRRPLCDLDPVACLCNFYLAASAPALRACILPLVLRIDRIQADYGLMDLERDNRAVAACWLAAWSARPPESELRAARKEVPELDLKIAA
jgi:hypothetical protein